MTSSTSSTSAGPRHAVPDAAAPPVGVRDDAAVGGLVAATALAGAPMRRAAPVAGVAGRRTAARRRAAWSCVTTCSSGR